MLSVISSIILGTLLSGIWFGLNIIINILASKLKVDWLAKHSVLFSALLPTIIILKNSSLCLWNIENVAHIKSWLLILATVLLTAVIVANNKVENLPTGKELLAYALDGIFMEVPQRMMMQSFIHMILSVNEMYIVMAPLLTAVVWCISICIQGFVMKQCFEKSVFYELLASFVFSVGVGYVLLESGFIGFTMVAHFMERLVSTHLRKWMAKR